MNQTFKKVTSLFVSVLFVLSCTPNAFAYQKSIESDKVSYETVESMEETNAPEIVEDEEPAQIEKAEIYSPPTYYSDYSEYDRYLLAKIAMAEAEGSSFETKMCIVSVVLNRVESPLFPNTVEEVLYVQSNGVYQFSPIGNGRWERSNPNDECIKAVSEILSSTYDISNGGLYFESCENPDNWHSQNLTFVHQSDGTRFYSR